MFHKVLTIAALAVSTWAGAAVFTSGAAEAHGYWRHHNHCTDNMCYYRSPWHDWHRWRDGWRINGEPWWVWQNPYPYHRHHKHHRHHHRTWIGTHCWTTTDWHHHIPYDVKVCKTVYP